MTGRPPSPAEADDVTDETPDTDPADDAPAGGETFTDAEMAEELGADYLARLDADLERSVQAAADAMEGKAPGQP